MNIIILHYNKKIKATVGKPSVLEASTLSVCLSVCPSVRLSVCPSVRLSVRGSVEFYIQHRCRILRLKYLPQIQLNNTA
jgi:hypothetical protein